MATRAAARPDTFYINRLQPGMRSERWHSGTGLGASAQSYSFVVPVPCHQPPDALLDRRIRTEPELTHEIRDVGEGFRNIAGLHRHELAFRGASRRLLDQAQDLADINRAAVADVVEAPRRAAAGKLRMLARPLWIALRRAVEDPQHGFRRIVDIGEIPPHPAMVEQRNRASLEYGGGEPPHRHVGPPPRAIDREEPQPRRRNREQMRVSMRHQLVRLFGRAIEAERVVRGLRGAERSFGVRAVDRGGRRVDEMP